MKEYVYVILTYIGDDYEGQSYIDGVFKKKEDAQKEILQLMEEQEDDTDYITYSIEEHILN